MRRSPIPDDSNGVYSLPSGTIVSTGDTILPSQHNPWANDNANAMSNRFSKDGRAPATGNWNLNGFRITQLGGPSASADAANKAYVDAVTTNVSASTRGYLFGLTLSNNATDAVNDIDIALGAASSDAVVPVAMTLSSALTKRLDAAWAVGTGNGGLDTGSIANGTYHVWLIQRSDTSVVDVCFSASAVSPTFGGNIPTAYDRKRRIGSIVRVSASIKAFKQDGDRFIWATSVGDVSASAPGSAAVTRTLTVPTGISVTAILSLQYFNNVASTAASYFLVSDLGVPDAAPGTTAFSLSIALTAVEASGQVLVQTNTSGQVRSRTDTIAATISFLITTAGFIDTRGRV